MTPLGTDHDPEAGHHLANTERGRQTAVTVEGNPRVGVSKTDPEDPSRRLSVRAS